MSPIGGPGIPTAVAARDLRLGRIAYPTVHDELKEQVGEQLETAGQAVTPGDPRARPFPLNVPIHGDHRDVDGPGVAERLRRQTRSRFDNNEQELVWFAFDADPDLNRWLTVGAAELEYAEGGVALSDYRLSLSDCFHRGNRRTHRPARRLQQTDRRLSTVARDFRRTVFSTDFAGTTPISQVVLPVGVSDVGDTTRAPVATTALATIHGNLATVAGRADKEVLRFEQAETDEHKADALALDRRGVTAPTYTLAGDAAPQTSYGWEEVYGPDHDLTAGDVPVLQNGLCRVRWVDSVKAFALDGYVVGTGYVEQGRVTLWRDNPAGTETQHTTLLSVRVVRWTSDRAVVLARLAIGSTDRCDVYLTLQRGWTGPRVEAYGTWTSSSVPPGVAVRVIPITAGTTTRGRSNASGTVTATDYGNFSGLQPWAYLLPASPNLALHMAVLQTSVKMIGKADTVSYGATRNGVSISQQNAVAHKGYVSVTLGIGARGAETADATALGQTNLYDQRSLSALVARG